MSAELPQLERLIADAAERHYGGRRRWHLPAPRLSLVAGLAAAAAAVVLAIAIFPLRSDEQTAPRPAGDAAAELAARYSVFAGAHAPSKLETAALDDHADVLDLGKPVTTRVLRRFSDGGIVAVVGTTRTRAETAVCLWMQRESSGSGTCALARQLLASRRPWFGFGSVGQYTNEVTALVPDDIKAVQIELKSGEIRDVQIENNLAYAAAREPICRADWTTADGRAGHERGPTRAEEATPDEPSPPTC